MINVHETFQALKKHFSPKIVTEVNDQYVKIVKILGQDVPWHNHANEDELFFIIKGSLVMEIENEQPFSMREGDIFVVPKAVNHRVSSEQECQLILIESKTTRHTGEVKAGITKSIEEQI